MEGGQRWPSLHLLHVYCSDRADLQDAVCKARQESVGALPPILNNPFINSATAPRKVQWNLVFAGIFFCTWHVGFRYQRSIWLGRRVCV